MDSLIVNVDSVFSKFKEVVIGDVVNKFETYSSSLVVIGIIVVDEIDVLICWVVIGFVLTLKKLKKN